VQHFVNSYTHNPSKLLGPVASFGVSVAAGVAAIVVVLLTSLYTAIHPEPLLNGLIRLFPVPRRQHVHHILIGCGRPIWPGCAGCSSGWSSSAGSPTSG
jgi:predicted PurR-regulated permease PerM